MRAFHAEYLEIAGVARLSTEIVTPRPEATGSAVRYAAHKEQPTLAAREQFEHPCATFLRAPGPWISVNPPHRSFAAIRRRYLRTPRVKARPEPGETAEESMYPHG